MRRGPHDIDWVGIRQEYIETLPKMTQQVLAKKHDIHPNMISAKAVEEHWDLLRERYITRLMEMREDRKAETVATEGASWDSACLEAAKKLLELAVAELEGAAAKDGHPAIAPMRTKEVASSIKVAQDVGRAALGDTLNKGDDVKIIIESLLMPLAGKEAAMQRITAEANSGLASASTTVTSAIVPVKDGSNDNA